MVTGRWCPTIVQWSGFTRSPLLSLNQIFSTSCPENIFVFRSVDIQNVFKRKRIWNDIFQLCIPGIHFTYSRTGGTVNIPSYKYYCLKSWRIGRIYCWTWADVYLTNTFHNWKSTVTLKLSPRTTTTYHLPISQISEQTLKSLEFIVTALQTVKKYNLRAGLELNKWVEENWLLKSSLVHTSRLWLKENQTN